MKKVLVVDDDPNIVEVLRLYFDKDGFAVISCLSGDRAIETFQTSQPDLVVLDLMLSARMATISAERSERHPMCRLLC